MMQKNTPNQMSDLIPSSPENRRLAALVHNTTALQWICDGIQILITIVSMLNAQWGQGETDNVLDE